MVRTEGKIYLPPISDVSCHLYLPLAATMLCCYLPSYYLGCCHLFKMIVGIQILEKRMKCACPTCNDVLVVYARNVIRLSCFLLCGNSKNAFRIFMRSCSCSD